MRNGNAPSLNDAVLTAQGHDPERIKDDPAGDLGGVSGSMLYDGAVETAKALIAELSGQGYDPAAHSGVEARRFPGPTEPLEQVLRFVCGTVKDKLNHTTDKMDNLLAGTEGRFVPPSLEGNPTRVLGVEPIPLAELGRPRLDVTLRISGLFRDMYPNLIRLMDQAENKIAALDEPEEQNFIRKHIHSNIQALTAEGLAEDKASEQSQVRVFGCAPGCYGTGVPHIIDSKEWYGCS